MTSGVKIFVFILVCVLAVTKASACNKCSVCPRHIHAVAAASGGKPSINIEKIREFYLQRTNLPEGWKKLIGSPHDEFVSPEVETILSQMTTITDEHYFIKAPVQASILHSFNGGELQIRVSNFESIDSASKVATPYKTLRVKLEAQRQFLFFIRALLIHSYRMIEKAPADKPVTDVLIALTNVQLPEASESTGLDQRSLYQRVLEDRFGFTAASTAQQIRYYLEVKVKTASSPAK